MYIIAVFIFWMSTFAQYVQIVYNEMYSIFEVKHMNFIPLFFLCVRMFHFIHAHRIVYFLQKFSQMLEDKRRHPERRQIILIDSSASIFVVYLLCDISFLLYCMYLMFHDDTWTPGFLLLIIAAMESAAIHLRISGTYDEDEEGFVYPRPWFRYLTFGESMFILLRLFEGA